MKENKLFQQFFRSQAASFTGTKSEWRKLVKSLFEAPNQDQTWDRSKDRVSKNGNFVRGEWFRVGF